MNRSINIMMNKKDFEIFKIFLETEKIQYEISQFYNQVYKIINVNENEIKKIYDFIAIEINHEKY